MTSFPGLSNQDIDNIIAYTSLPKPEPKVTAAPVAVSSGDDGTIQNMVLVGFVLVFLLLVIMFSLVTKSLTKLSQTNGIEEQPEVSHPIMESFYSESIFNVGFCNNVIISFCLFYVWILYASRY